MSLFGLVKRICGDLKKYNEYCLYTARAVLRSEVSTSYLDWVWWILEPFLTMLVYVFIFGVVFNASEPYFPVFIFIGILTQSFFSKMLNASTQIVRSNRSIITKVYVPKYILLVIEMYRDAYKMLFGMMIEFIMIIIYRVPITKHVLLTIPILLCFYLFTFSLSLLLLHYGVFVNDLSYAIGIVLRLLMYFSGVFFSIKKRMPGLPGILMIKFNPVAYFIDALRCCLLYAEVPSLLELLVWFVVSIVLSLIGIRLIYKYEDNYAKVI